MTSFALPAYMSRSVATAAAVRSGGGDSGHPVTEADSFPAQWSAIIDESRAQVWDCSRRAAKTSGLIRRTVKRSHERRGWRTLFIHHTRGLGKAQFYATGDEKKNPGVMELLKLKRIPLSYHNETDVNVRLANGSFIQVVGCDDAKDVGKKLGFQWNDIIIDECQEFADRILERLVDKTILPTLIDRGGSLTLSGTPAEYEAGVWYEAKTKGVDERVWSGHRWTLLDNPFIDRENIVKTMAIRGFKIDFSDPRNNEIIVQREIFGLQVVDPDRLMYCYRDGFNDLPADWSVDHSLDTWRFAMGIDFGGVTDDNDEDAIVVLGWRTDDPSHRIAEVESYTGREDSEQFCNRIVETYERWGPMAAICGDTGGGGNKALATVAKRIRHMMLTPKPTSVDLSMRLVNDELRSGRMRCRKNGAIARAAKTAVKGKHEPDVLAGLRYAHHSAYHYLAEAPPETDEDRRVREWLQRKAAMDDPYNPYRSYT